ncbi:MULTISPECIES: YrzI family small protein [Neobacillus]|uniref:YrzI family small protein n=1 Tax=Neobacillus rhizophilus TaxID=2833579 RepID=A0A942U7E7_9BACI|nr:MULTISPECIES: YrzI family small protein [Neobacillus]MBS4214028.1 YrzI family small protein [Neobacillus rhizophilus]MBU8917569.1 YrzI family small protein [Bacillus sp. FJAT-29953]
MIFNIIFFTIEIRKREANLEAAIHQEQVEKLYEEIKDRQIALYRYM